MKSRLEKKLELEEQQGQGAMDNNHEPEHDAEKYEDQVEVDASGPGVGSDKGSKMLVIIASAVLITVVLYFLFFRGEKTPKQEKLEEVKSDFSSNAEAPAAPEISKDNIGDDFDQLEKSAKSPDIPKLPELPTTSDGGGGLVGVLPKFLELPESKPASGQHVDLPQPATPQSSLPQQNQVNQPPQIVPQQPQSQIAQQPQSPAQQNAAAPTVQDPRRSPMIVLAGAGGPKLGVGYEKNIVVAKEDPISKLQPRVNDVKATIVADMTSTIVQGKMISAVLETAISTEVPGAVRAIISRDVYAESGNGVLIPRGSRLYGTYSSEVVRGQGRVDITWTRLIRPDGVDVDITFKASDQFGRSGIEGDVDNKYAAAIGNSILTSILAVSGAIAAEKLSGVGQTTTTTNANGTTTTGNASNQVIYDASKAIIDTAGKVLGNTLDVTPVIRVPQGTKISVIVNSDLVLPPVRPN